MSAISATSSMSAEFCDRNVIVCAYDGTAGVKRDAGSALLNRLWNRFWRSGEGVCIEGSCHRCRSGRRLPGLEPGSGRPPLRGGQQWHGSSAVDRFANNVGMSGVAGSLFDEVE